MMKRLFRQLLLTVAFVCLGGIASAGKSIAWVTSYYSGPAGYADHLADEHIITVMLESALGAQSDVSVVHYGLVDAARALDGSEPTPGDKSEESKVARIASAVKADYGCCGYITMMGGSIRLDVRLISADGVDLWVWGASTSVDKFDELIEASAKAMARMLEPPAVRVEPPPAKEWQDLVPLVRLAGWHGEAQPGSNGEYFGIAVAFRNKAEKAIVGIQWNLALLDEFDMAIASMSNSSYDVIPPGSSTPWKELVEWGWTPEQSSFVFDEILSTVKRNQHRIRVQVSKVAYEDGQVLSFPEGTWRTVLRAEFGQELR